MSEINMVNIALCETCRHRLDCSDVFSTKENCNLWKAVDSYCKENSMKHLRDFYYRDSIEATSFIDGKRDILMLKKNVIGDILALLPEYLDTFKFEEYSKHLGATFDYILDNYVIDCEIFKKVSFGHSDNTDELNTDDEPKHHELNDTSYLTIPNRDDALKIASMLIDNDYAVMLTTEEDLTIINYVNCCCSNHFARNDVVFMHREDFENHFE